MYKINYSGPNADPCGTPQIISLMLIYSPLPVQIVACFLYTVPLKSTQHNHSNSMTFPFVVKYIIFSGHRSEVHLFTSKW